VAESGCHKTNYVEEKEKDCSISISSHQSILMDIIDETEEDSAAA
jgi:hypothetical protein